MPKSGALGKAISDVYSVAMASRLAEDREAGRRIVDAHKFIFDASLIPLDLFQGAADFANQLSEHHILRLPFSSVVFVSGPWDSGNHPAGSSVVVAWQEDESIVGRLYLTNARSDGAAISYETTFRIQQGFIRTSERLHLLAGDSLLFSSMVFPDAGSAMIGNDGYLYALSMFCFTVFSGIGCLSAAGIATEEHNAPKFINEQRKKKGKPPIFEYKFVTVDMASLKIPGNSLGGTHASPRLHWRRGHVRRLPDGRITSVRPCLVGDPSRGAIEHDYRAKS